MEILFLDDHWEMWFTWHPGKNTVSVFNWFLNPVMLGRYREPHLTSRRPVWKGILH